MASEIPDLPKQSPDLSAPRGEEPAINTGNRVYAARWHSPTPDQGQDCEDD